MPDRSEYPPCETLDALRGQAQMLRFLAGRMIGDIDAIMAIQDAEGEPTQNREEMPPESDAGALKGNARPSRPDGSPTWGGPRKPAPARPHPGPRRRWHLCHRWPFITRRKRKHIEWFTGPPGPTIASGDIVDVAMGRDNERPPRADL